MRKMVLGVILIFIGIFTLSGCADMSYSRNWQSMSHIPIHNVEVQHIFNSNDFKVLGPVTVRAGGIKTLLWIFSWGRNGYAELYEAAKRKYGEVDTIINIMEDTRKLRIFGFPDIWFLGLNETAVFMKEERIITGVAIRYMR